MSPPSWMNRPLARLLPWLRRAAPWLCALSLLGGCGGAMENSDSEGDIARGLWSGASTDGRAVLLWVFGDGQWAGVYSSASNPTALAGGWTGRGSTSLSTFTSSSAREYSLEAAAARSASLTAAVKKSSTLAGTVGASGNLLTVATTYQSAFDSTAALASLVGTHLGTVSLIGGSLAANLQVASTGGGERHPGQLHRERQHHRPQRRQRLRLAAHAQRQLHRCGSELQRHGRGRLRRQHPAAAGPGGQRRQQQCAAAAAAEDLLTRRRRPGRAIGTARQSRIARAYSHFRVATQPAMMAAKVMKAPSDSVDNPDSPCPMVQPMAVTPPKPISTAPIR